nr:membrane protein YpdK [Erwinia persicina]
MTFILQGNTGKLASDPAHIGRSEDLFVKYALMGISFILLIWVGTFYLML